MPVGAHILLDLFDIASDRLTDVDALSRALVLAADAAKMTALSAPVVHVFPGGGLTAFLPLAESHIAIHTFPERGYLAADIFTCGDPDRADHAAETLIASVAPCRPERTRVVRG